MKNNTFNPYRYYLLIAVILLLSIGISICKFTTIYPLWIYLVSITLITFFFYGYDKHNAIKNKNRVPELVLHLLALVGGSIGALAGQYIFHHKTKKLKFQIVFILIAIAQISLVVWLVMKDKN